MKKLNCWEFMKCGRESALTDSEGLGVCPAATEVGLNGMHGGKNAGRACWVIAGTMCGGEVQGFFARKYKDCGKCNFYINVKIEEGFNFRMPTLLLNMRE